ncbi:hypothetical protein [Morganella psychrotolerans]|uniref:hypothetical protein n=1 Tax=Morganella psychrotolerans TaxID=368603 RepID=UPI0012EA4AED|nr:hypothetical protein [Morganella psychrotolerans]
MALYAFLFLPVIPSEFLTMLINNYLLAQKSEKHTYFYQLAHLNLKNSYLKLRDPLNHPVCGKAAKRGVPREHTSVCARGRRAQPTQPQTGG